MQDWKRQDIFHRLKIKQESCSQQVYIVTQSIHSVLVLQLIPGFYKSLIKITSEAGCYNKCYK
jgi:hypothetical protein